MYIITIWFDAEFSECLGVHVELDVSQANLELTVSVHRQEPRSGHEHESVALRHASTFGLTLALDYCILC